MADDKSTRTDKNAAHHPVDHAALAGSVKASLNTAKQKTDALRRRDSQLFTANVVSPAAATLLAALATVIGGNQMFPQAAAQVDDGGWKLACALVAVFGFIATISSMFKKQFGDRLTQGNQCVGELLKLDLEITTGVRSWDAAAKEYGEIVKTYPEFIS